MVERVVYESYQGHMKRKIINWTIPLLFIVLGVAFWGDASQKTIPFWITFIGVFLTGLNIYFTFFRKKRRH